MSRLRVTTALAAIVALVAGAAPAAAADPVDPVAVTDRGLVRGSAADGVHTFQGIPYAAPPVGRLRWRSPAPVHPWLEIRNATRPGSACPQSAGEVPDGSVNEDCLHLNVTTPAKPSLRPRPVVVWVHGGGFTGGAGSTYDPRRMATRGDVVVVTVNYRLGVFGFLGHPGLSGSGTFGLQDQLAALRWVRRNAAFFGGDPANVTVAGESAGSMSICALLTSPQAVHAFDKAVLESGSCMLRWTKNTWWPGLDEFTPYVSRADALATGTEAAAAMKCDRPDPAATLECLRGKDVKSLLGIELPLNAPTYGTSLLPVDPAQALRTGRFHRKPVLSGGTRDEGNGFASALELQQHVTEQRYTELLKDSFGAYAGRVAARYPAASYSSPAQAWGAVISDRAWACPTLTGNQLLARRTSTYPFEFADRTAPSLGDPAPPGFTVGAFHGSELAYLFDLLGEHYLTTPAQERLAGRMIDYWTRFARTGNPNAPASPPGNPAPPPAPTPSPSTPGPPPPTCPPATTATSGRPSPDHHSPPLHRRVVRSSLLQRAGTSYGAVPGDGLSVGSTRGCGPFLRGVVPSCGVDPAATDPSPQEAASSTAARRGGAHQVRLIGTAGANSRSTPG